ncbi:MAG: hypothetical protein ACXV5R_04730, partial [Candidatus Angelobacter sp.]
VSVARRLGFWKPLQRTIFFLSFQLRSVWRMGLGGSKAVLVRAIAKLLAIYSFWRNKIVG